MSATLLGARGRGGDGRDNRRGEVSSAPAGTVVEVAVAVAVARAAGGLRSGQLIEHVGDKAAQRRSGRPWPGAELRPGGERRGWARPPRAGSGGSGRQIGCAGRRAGRQAGKEWALGREGAAVVRYCDGERIHGGRCRRWSAVGCRAACATHGLVPVFRGPRASCWALGQSPAPAASGLFSRTADLPWRLAPSAGRGRGGGSTVDGLEAGPARPHLRTRPRLAGPVGPGPVLAASAYRRRGSSPIRRPQTCAFAPPMRRTAVCLRQ